MAIRVPSASAVSQRSDVTLPVPSDDETRVAIAEELARDHHLVASGITSSVVSGIVELGGSTAVWPWKERAERVCRVVRGVRAVVNRIRVTPVRRADPETAKDVRRALRATAGLAAMRIGVRVSEGVVELTGGITSFEEQQLAERVAVSVPGVRFCQNQLSADARIARTPAVLVGDVRSRLEWDPLVQHDPIRVEVNGTRVLLSGTVGSSGEAKRAFNAAWAKDVTAVDITALKIDHSRRPDANVRARWPSDSEISGTIPELARRWPNSPIARLSITVLDGVVTLRGTVSTFNESVAAAEVVRAVVGVVRVDNQVRGPWWKEPVSRPAPVRRRPKRRTHRR